MPTEDLIRAALAAEADRAPASADVLAALPDALVRRRARDRRLGVAGAAAAVVVAAVAAPLVLQSVRPTGLTPAASTPPSTPPSTPSVASPSLVPASTSALPQGSLAGSPPVTPPSLAPPPGGRPVFPVGYLPTVPPGWVSTERPVSRGADDTAVTLLWTHAGDMALTLAIGSDAQPTRGATQVGAVRHIDVGGAPGTLRVGIVSDNTGTAYFDDLWWSPKPGVVLTLTIGNSPTDPAAELPPIARSVVPTTDTTEVPFRLPALPPGTVPVSESIYGTSPANWHVDGVIGQHQGTVLLVEWGPGNQNVMGKANVTVRGVPGFYIGNDDSAYVTAHVDGWTLTVEHNGPMSKDTLLRIVDDMRLYPDVSYPWLGRS